MRFSTRFIAAAVLILVVSGSAHAQKKYAVKIDRAWTVGQTYQITCDISQRQSLVATTPDGEKKEDSFDNITRLVASGTITEANAASRRIGVTYVVRRYVDVDGEDTTELIPAGTQLIYTSSKGESKLRATNGDVEDYLLNNIKEALDEASFGLEGMGAIPSKAVGETWDISKGAAVKGFVKTHEMVVGNKGMKATARLAGISEEAATPSMKVAMDINVNDFKIPELAPLKISKSSAVINYVGDYPIDEAKGPLTTKMTMQVNIKASGKPDPSMPKMQADMQLKREVVTTYSYN